MNLYITVLCKVSGVTPLNYPVGLHDLLIELFRLESTCYEQTHTRTILNQEKKYSTEVLSKLRQDNQTSDRAIKQGKLAMSKKEKAQKEKKEDRDNLHLDVEELNEKIFDYSWDNFNETKRLKDRQLTKKAQQETNQARQEHNLVEIDISIAQSRIKDLENQKAMSNSQIEDILTEKRRTDKENLELEYKIQGRGQTEADQRAKFTKAEEKMKMQLEHAIQAATDQSEIMLD